MSLKTVAPKPRVRKTNLGYKVYQLMSKKMFLTKASASLLKASESGKIPSGIGVFLHFYSRNELDKKNNPSANIVKFLDNRNLCTMSDLPVANDEFIHGFKEIKKLNDRDQVELMLNEYIDDMISGELIEETKETADKYFFLIRKKYIKECKNDWFELARYYDLTGGEPKDWYEMNEDWNLSVDEQRTMSLVFIYNMMLGDDLSYYFNNFIEEFLDEAESLD
ncbi:MAG TPA: hypothetical protein PLP75_02325 [Burkholderiales bacterium]|jgi:transcriptional regulator with XRE-family HTH domain|nr:hypothetical protein [Burkholderiales bacterium]